MRYFRVSSEDTLSAERSAFGGRDVLLTTVERAYNPLQALKQAVGDGEGPHAQRRVVVIEEIRQTPAAPAAELYGEIVAGCWDERHRSVFPWHPVKLNAVLDRLRKAGRVSPRTAIVHLMPSDRVSGGEVALEVPFIGSTSRLIALRGDRDELADRMKDLVTDDERAAIVAEWLIERYTLIS